MENKQQEEMVLLIAGHQSRLRAFLRCLLVRGADVDDVLQDISRVLWQKADDYQSGSDFWAWASQVARFEVMNYFRKRARDRHVPDLGLIQQLAVIADEESGQMEDRRTALEECLSLLPATQRQLVELKYFSDQSIDAISRSVDRTPATVRQTLYRIREVLRQCVARKLGRAST